MKIVMMFTVFMLLPSMLAAKTHYLSVEDYQQARNSYQLQGQFPELIVFNDKDEVVLRCDAPEHETTNCFNHALELMLKTGMSTAVYTLDLPFCSVCLEWNAQLQGMLKQSEGMILNLYYVGN